MCNDDLNAPSPAKPILSITSTPIPTNEPISTALDESTISESEPFYINPLNIVTSTSETIGKRYRKNKDFKQAQRATPKNPDSNDANSACRHPLQLFSLFVAMTFIGGD